ncbi:MAG: LysM peptidoglycan-binding domain-containing protein [Chloroflexi bacterium]|nr:LysM peptidoglycan-binding domain-containing protein [Chloroflexota bacterium]
MLKLSDTKIIRGLTLIAALAIFFALLPPSTEAAPPRQGQVVYYVQYGDTLFSISRRFGTSVDAIKSANGLVSDFIYAGQRLVIPYGVSIFSPQPLPAITRTPFPAGSTACKYTVQSRDTVFSIAYRYRVTVSDLMQSNFLYTPFLRAGQQLNVPCASATPAPFQTYTVVAGDNLFRLAIRNNTSIYALALVNGIPNPNWIFVGQTIVIPYPGSYVFPTGIPNAPGPSLNHIVIAEFRTRGPNGGNDEFIELYNPTNSSFNISGWLVKSSSSSGVTDTRVTINTTVLLASGKRYLLTNTNPDGGYSGPTNGDQTYTVGIADDGGIALTMPDGTTIVDQVGMSAGSAYKENSPLAILSVNEDRSYSRRNNACTDSDNNANDFQSTAPSSPQNSAAPASFCAATPTPTFTPVSATFTPTSTGPTVTPTPGTPTPSAAAVVMQNISFLPATLTLARGSTVTWTNIDTIAHTVSSGTPGVLSGLFRSNQLAPGQTFSFSFSQAGAVQYFCEIHGAQMTGTITIQ